MSQPMLLVHYGKSVPLMTPRVTVTQKDGRAVLECITTMMPVFLPMDCVERITVREGEAIPAKWPEDPGDVGFHIQCPSCDDLTRDQDAKFCRYCGAAVSSKDMAGA